MQGIEKIRVVLAAILLVLSVAALPGCASLDRRPPPPTVEEVVSMSRGGTPPDRIIARMRDSRAVYRLPASELARLRERGVHDMVIDYMQRTWLEDSSYGRAPGVSGGVWAGSGGRSGVGIGIGF